MPCDGSRHVPAAARGGVMTMGNFDGVHRGHQTILARVVEAAVAQHATAIAYTFYPHPATVLAPALGLSLLQTLAQRTAALARCGIALTVVEPFTAAFAALTAPQFFQEIIVDRFAPRRIIIGYDFTFGRHRGGRVADLAALCTHAGIACDVVEPVFVGQVLVSSTYIRQCVAHGAMDDAALALGRPYALSGTVVSGHGLGRQLGFPTINIVPENALIPPEGVYVTSAQGGADQPAIPAATYIGRRPTFGGTALVVETYLLADPVSTPHTLEVRFHTRLRGDVRFDTAEALKQQIAQDVAQARAWHEKG